MHRIRRPPEKGPDRWDIRAFELLAPVYDRIVPGIDVQALRKGLYSADREPERILDVGGGTGRNARAFDAIVVDASRNMCKEADAKGLPAVRGAAGSLPVCDECVDAAFVVDALHHFPDRGAAIESIAGALRPGGVIVVQEFDRSTRRGRLLDLGESMFGFDSTFYTADELVEAIESVGLEARPIEWGFEFTIAGVKPTEGQRP